MKKSILALFCVILLVFTTSCNSVDDKDKKTEKDTQSTSFKNNTTETTKKLMFDEWLYNDIDYDDLKVKNNVDFKIYGSLKAPFSPLDINREDIRKVFCITSEYGGTIEYNEAFDLQRKVRNLSYIDIIFKDSTDLHLKFYFNGKNETEKLNDLINSKQYGYYSPSEDLDKFLDLDMTGVEWRYSFDGDSNVLPIVSKSIEKFGKPTMFEIIKDERNKITLDDEGNESAFIEWLIVWEFDDYVIYQHVYEYQELLHKSSWHRKNSMLNAYVFTPESWRNFKVSKEFKQW